MCTSNFPDKSLEGKSWNDSRDFLLEPLDFLEGKSPRLESLACSDDILPCREFAFAFARARAHDNLRTLAVVVLGGAR